VVAVAVALVASLAVAERVRDDATALLGELEEVARAGDALQIIDVGQDSSPRLASNVLLSTGARSGGGGPILVNKLAEMGEHGHTTEPTLDILFRITEETTALKFPPCTTLIDTLISLTLFLLSLLP